MLRHQYARGYGTPAPLMLVLALARGACPTAEPALLDALAPRLFLAPGSAGYMVGAPFDAPPGAFAVGFFAGAAPGAAGAVGVVVDGVELDASAPYTLAAARASALRVRARADVLHADVSGGAPSPLRVVFAAADAAGRPIVDATSLKASLTVALADDGSAYCLSLIHI